MDNEQIETLNILKMVIEKVVFVFFMSKIKNNRDFLQNLNFLQKYQY